MKKTDPQPPAIFRCFFRWFCHPDLVDFIEGDLMQLYNEKVRECGKVKADVKFILDVLLLFRPGIIRPIKGQKTLIPYGMYKNHFKVGLRNIVKQKVFFLINTIGLSAGLTCFALISLWVNDELRYDRFNKNYDHIVRLVRTTKTESGIAESAGTGAPIAQVLKNEFAEVQQVARLDMRGDIITHQGQQFHQQGILLADPTFFDIFSHTLLKGNTATALNEPFTLVLTESASRKYFGQSDPIGETLTINLHDSTGYGARYKITGVMPDPPTNAHFTFTMIASFKTVEVSKPSILSVEGWEDTSFYTYLLLKEEANREAFEEKITYLYDDYIGNASGTTKNKYSFRLQPLGDIYLQSHLQNEIGITGKSDQVYLFSVIGIFILVLAGINYVNLATASSVKRAKEVGIKKVIGAHKNQLVAQYLCESILTALISLIISLLLCSLLQPAFYQLTGKNIHLFSSPFLLVLIAGVSLLLGIASGLYPAVLLSGFRPAGILKGNYRQGKSGVLLRKSLVVAQFTTAIVFITGIIVINSQLVFIRDKDLGFSKDGLLFLRIHGNTDVIKGYDAFKHELLSNPLIHATATSNTIPLGGLEREEAETVGYLDNSIQVNIPTLRIDSDYLNAFGLKLVAGRNFHAGIIRDTIQPVILNEAAIQTLGWQTSQAAIGKRFKVGGREGEVIGVVKNFHFSSLHERIGPLAIYPVSQRFSRIILNVSADSPVVTVAWIQRVWRKHFPSALLDYSFVDAQIGEQYLAEKRFSQILMYSSIMSLLIACLGLYGLILNAATQKVKEIGIRKVLGASVNNIAIMLTKDFLKLVFISMFVAVPIAWYIISNWLENFAYRTAITGWMFAAAGVIVVLIATATIGAEAIKAGLTNPVKSLRSE